MERQDEGTDRARQIFEAVRGIPEHEWEALLREHCGADTELRRRVEELLSAATETVDVRAPVPVWGDRSAGRLVDQLRERPPAHLRYRVIGEIGRGGMAAVLKVHDEDLERSLAMKVILGRAGPGSEETPPADSTTVARFVDEAQVTGQLDHPGVVPIHELGLDAEGRLYFTMRLVKGETLEDVFGRLHQGDGEWTRSRVLEVIRRVCEAVAYAHSRKVIHRDLKPANIMVGKFGETYVMDWGLAKVLDRGDPHDIRIRREPGWTATSVRTERSSRDSDPDTAIYTMDGDIVGTPAYMAPEQARGEIEKVGPPADVYSMGAILYHLLAGHMPYIPTGARASAHTVLGWVVAGPPTPLRKIRPDLPAPLVAICEKAMARDPAERYADMLEMAEDLRAYSEHRLVRARESLKRSKIIRALHGLTRVLLIGVLLWVGLALLIVFFIPGSQEVDSFLDVPISFTVSDPSYRITAGSGDGEEVVWLQNLHGTLGLPIGMGSRIAMVLIVTALVMFVIFQLHKVLESLKRGTPFLQSNVRRIRWLGAVLVGVGLLESLFHYLSPLWHLRLEGITLTGGWELEWHLLAAGVIVLILAEVFRVGAELEGRLART